MHNMEMKLSALGSLFLIVCTVNCLEYEGCNHTCLVTDDISQRCMYQRIGQKCYYQFSKNATWIVNRQWCIDQGLEMVRLSRETIPDIAQLHFNYPVEATPIKWRYMWLAGKGVTFADWTFLNDTPVVHTSIVVGSVSDGPFESCGFLDSGDFSLKTSLCHDKKKFLCRNGNDVTAFKRNATWSQARERCLLLGGDLFYLRDESSEMPYEYFIDSIKSAMNKSLIPIGQQLHIGVNRLSWKWPNDDPIAASNWGKGTALYHRDTCLAVKEEGLWYSRDCNDEYQAFCQNAHLVSDSAPGKNCVEIQRDLLKALIVAGTLAGVFLLACLILAAILISISRKLRRLQQGRGNEHSHVISNDDTQKNTPQEGEGHRQATRQDTNGYDYINMASYIKPPAPSSHASKGQLKQDEQKPKNEDYSYAYMGPKADIKPRHQYLEMI